MYNITDCNTDCSVYCFAMAIKRAVICACLVSRPVTAPQSDRSPKPSRDARLSTDRRPRDKYAGVKSSGYSRRSPPSKLAASKSAYSPAIKERTGQCSATFI